MTAIIHQMVEGPAEHLAHWFVAQCHDWQGVAPSDRATLLKGPLAVRNAAPYAAAWRRVQVTATRTHAGTAWRELQAGRRLYEYSGDLTEQDCATMVEGTPT